jgi:hypothetical protein
MQQHGTREDPLAFEERAARLRAALGSRIRPVALDDVGGTPDVFAPGRAEGT